MRLSPFSPFYFILFLREANSVYNLGQYKATYFYAKGCKNPSVLSAFLSQWGIVCTGSCIQNGVIGMKNECNLRGNLVHLNCIHQKFFHCVLTVAWMTSFLSSDRHLEPVMSLGSWHLILDDATIVRSLWEPPISR